MFKWILILFSLLIASCSQDTQVKNSQEYEKVELQLKEAFFIVKKQEGRDTYFELALPQQLPWPSMEAYEDREYSLPLGYEIVGRLRSMDRLKVGQVLKKSSLLSGETFQWYSQLATSQGLQWVNIDILMGAWVHPHIFHRESTHLENHYVKLLK